MDSGCRTFACDFVLDHNLFLHFPCCAFFLVCCCIHPVSPSLHLLLCTQHTCGEQHVFGACLDAGCLSQPESSGEERHITMKIGEDDLEWNRTGG